MLSKIRLATADEIKKIESFSDLNDGCTVLAFGEGDDIDFAVLRNLIEIDPLVAAKDNTKRKALFVWAIENMLRFQGVKRYYFNISPADETWKLNVEHWGAQQISKEPELRFRKDL
jgi:hypothetical protein